MNAIFPGLGQNFAPAIRLVTSFFEARPQEGPEAALQPQRQPLSTFCPIDCFFTYGSCVPLISNAVGMTRVLYGAVIITLGIAEVINKIAKARFAQDASFFDKLTVLRGGSVPLILKGVEHVSLGISAQMSILGNISCALYELVVKSYLPQALKQEVSVDTHNIQELVDRIKRHSAVRSVQDAFREFTQLLING